MLSPPPSSSSAILSAKRRNRINKKRQRQGQGIHILLLLAVIINVSSAFSVPATTKITPCRRHSSSIPSSSSIYPTRNAALQTLLPSTKQQQQQHQHQRQKFPTTTTSKTQLHMSTTPTTTAASAATTLIQSFTKSSSASPFATITEVATSTPPIAYFLALLSAGFGIPVSEDALCIFSGAVVLPSVDTTQMQIQLLLALYGGVVLSDMITFLIGRSLRLGIMDPIRRYLNIGGGSSSSVSQVGKKEEETKGKKKSALVILPEEEEQKADKAIVGATGMDGLTDYEHDELRTTIRKRDRIKSRIYNAGDYIGFVTRVSVGVRGPIMLLSGFSGSVEFWKFALGSCVGACVSLPMQLGMGYVMRDNPGAVVKAIAGISTLAVGVPAVIAVGSWVSMVMRRVKRVKKEESSDVVVSS